MQQVKKNSIILPNFTASQVSILLPYSKPSKGTSLKK